VTDSNKNDATEAEEKPGRFSLHGLSAAFARLTGASEPETAAADEADSNDEAQQSAEFASSEVLSPRMIVEGMLFVGSSDGRSLTSREMAAPIRDVSPHEVETLIEELNGLYEKTETTYRIVSEGQGFRFALGPKFDPIRHRFSGHVREAKLTTTAIEVLSVVAYRQPIGADEVALLRGSRSQAPLSQLVRRGLISLERPADTPRKPVYRTTDRFNALFRIDSPKDLPSSQDFDDC